MTVLIIGWSIYNKLPEKEKKELMELRDDGNQIKVNGAN